MSISLRFFLLSYEIMICEINLHGGQN